MTIETVSLKHWKGQTRSFSISPLTLLVGGNGSGKSAILSGIQFACMGHISQVGHRPEQTALFCSDRSCRVDVVLSDGFAWFRALDKTEKGTQTSLRVANNRERGLRKLEAVLFKKIGRFSPAWDLSIFFGMSPDKRRDFILELCGTEATSDPAGLLKRFHQENLKMHPNLSEHIVDVASHTPQTLDDLALHHLSDSERGALSYVDDAVVRSMCPGDLGSMILSALDAVGEIKRRSATEAAASRSACAELSQRQLEISCPAGSIDQARQRVESLATRMRVLHGNLRACQERVERRKKLEERISEKTEARTLLKSQLIEEDADLSRMKQEAKSDSLTWDSLVREREEANKKAQAATRQLLEAKEALGCMTAHEERALQLKHMIHQAKSNMQQVGCKLAGLDKAPDEFLEEHQRAESDLNNLSTRNLSRQIASEEALVHSRERALSTHLDWITVIDLLKGVTEQDVPDSVRATLSKIGDLASKHAGESIRKKIRELDDRKNKLKGLWTELRRTESEIKALEEKLATMEPLLHPAQQFVDLERRIATLESTMSHEIQAQKEFGDITESRKRVEELERDAQELQSVAARVGDSLLTQKNPSAVSNSIKALESRRASKERAMMDLGNEIDRLTEELRSIPNDEQDQIEGDYQIAREEHEEAKADMRAIESYTMLTGELSACSARAVEKQLIHETAKRYEIAIKQVREEIMDELTSPIKSHMDAFLSALGPTKTYFSFDNPTGTKVVFHMGWFRPEVGRVEFNALSGGERTLFMASMAYAFLALAQPPLKALLVEAAEVDQEHLRKLLICCEDAIHRSVVDNIIIATHIETHTEGYEWAKYNLEHMSNEAHAEPAASR